MRPTVFSLSLRFVFNCQEQQVHREDVALDAAAALFQILVKLFRVRSRRFHVVMSAILLFEERKKERNIYHLSRETRSTITHRDARNRSADNFSLNSTINARINSRVKLIYCIFQPCGYLQFYISLVPSATLQLLPPRRGYHYHDVKNAHAHCQSIIYTSSPPLLAG